MTSRANRIPFIALGLTNITLGLSLIAIHFTSPGYSTLISSVVFTAAGIGFLIAGRKKNK